MSSGSYLQGDVRGLLPLGGDGLPSSDRLVVTLGQKAFPVGELRLHTMGENTVSEFVYSAAWLKHRKFFPVSPDLRNTTKSQWRKTPKTRGRNTFAGLAETMPSGFGLTVFQRAYELGMLDGLRDSGGAPGLADAVCSILDPCRLGALRIHPAAGPSGDIGGDLRFLPRHIDLGAVADAVEAFERGHEDARQLEMLLRCATSLGGARPKCTYVQEDGRPGVAKFPSVFDEFPANRIEVFTMYLAQACEINVLSVKLLHPVNAPFVVASRFDRDPGGSRQPFLSARSLLLAEDEDDVDYLELLGVMRFYCKDFKADANQLWRRLVFSRLIGHSDSDLRKFGFLYAGSGRWRLAPAHGLRLREIALAPSAHGGITKDARNAALEGLIKNSEAFEIAPGAAHQILRHQIETIRSWRKLASRFDVGLTSREIEMLEGTMDRACTI